MFCSPNIFRRSLRKHFSSMKRLPDYLKRQIIDTEKTKNVRTILKHNCLNTVCENARCPNKNECYQKNTATFLIMGNVCTRNCRYCNIGYSKNKLIKKFESVIRTTNKRCYLIFFKTRLFC